MPQVDGGGKAEPCLHQRDRLDKDIVVRQEGVADRQDRLKRRTAAAWFGSAVSAHAYMANVSRKITRRRGSERA